MSQILFITGSVRHTNRLVLSPRSIKCPQKPTRIFMTHDPDKLSRRDWLIASSLAAVSVFTSTKPEPAFANVGGKYRCDALNGITCTSDGQRIGSLQIYDPPKVDSQVTQTAFLEVSAIGQTIGNLEINLFGTIAPKSVDIFARMCEGTFVKPLSYQGSQLFRVRKDKAIFLGRLSKGQAIRQENYIDNIGHVRTRNINAAVDTYNTEENKVPIDQPGLVLMTKGGGSFEFLIKTAPGIDDDINDSEYIVIGAVRKGMDVLARLNVLAVNLPTGYKDAFISAGKLINDKRAVAAQDDVFKPLQKTVIKRCGLVQKA